MALDKSRETRLRHAARRQGLELHRSRRRDPAALDYGLYHLTDPRTIPGTIVFGMGPAPLYMVHAATLDEIEAWLRTGARRRARSGALAGSV